jgi:alpha-D-ribose 1-methylphosphonate 5-triphosphate diphosphatase PhnM
MEEAIVFTNETEFQHWFEKNLSRFGIKEIFLSTDYGGGNHSPILKVLELAIEQKVVTLPEAISMVTGKPSRTIPRLAPGRGVIAHGAIADLVIVRRSKISQIEETIIGGIRNPLHPTS